MPPTVANSVRPTLAPMPLRILLGLTFLWAGWGKIEATMPVKGDDAARLANLGIIAPARTAPSSPSTAPAQPLPTQQPAGTPGASLNPSAPGVWTLAQSGTSMPPPPPAFTAADFPNDQPVKRLWGIALRVSKAGDPPTDASGKTLTTTWPAMLSTSPWPKAQAQAVLITELLCGAFVLVGVLTRVSSLALAAVMLGAMWLDQMTPAIQAGTAVLGILPGHGAFDVRAWMPLAWQAALLAAALSLAASGPGRLSVDLALRAGAASRSHPAPAPAGRGA